MTSKDQSPNLNGEKILSILNDRNFEEFKENLQRKVKTEPAENILDDLKYRTNQINDK